MDIYEKEIAPDASVSADGFLAVGHQFAGMNVWAGALAAYQEADKRRRRHAPTLEALGDALKGLNRPVDAAGSYKRALILDKGNERIQAKLAEVAR